MRKLMYLIGSSLGGWLGWWLGARFGMMTGFFLSVIGSAIAFYFTKRFVLTYMG